MVLLKPRMQMAAWGAVRSLLKRNHTRVWAWGALSAGARERVESGTDPV